MDNHLPSPESAFEQAKKYGEDLAKLYALEKAKRVNLQISNQKLQAVISTTPDGLAVLNQTLHIEEANPAFWAMTEKPATGQTTPVLDVLPFPDLIDRLQTPQQNAIHFEVDLQISATVFKTLLINAVPLTAGGNRTGWVLSLHDLTEQKRLESLKNEFINIAAHELRTPLAAVLGFSQVLKENLPPDGENADLASHLIDTILSSSNRLKSIIDELIEFADIRYQADGTQPAETFELIPVIRQVLEELARKAQEKSLGLETHFPKHAITLSGDSAIIREALKHIFENAILFNKKEGRVIIRVVENDDAIIVEVEDTGIGIPQTEISKIFDKFYQVEEHLTRSVGGLGLGLAIAQRGINLLGGAISVQSKLNEGTCFSIILPKTAAAPAVDYDAGLKDSYEQTLEYGKDLARAVAAERTMAKKLKKYEQLQQELQNALQSNPSIAEIKGIVDKLLPGN